MFICNDISRISDALISRCFIYRFNKINSLDMYDKLSEICNKERMGCESRERYDSLMQQIISHADGDMRKAINVLQGCCQNGHLEAEMLHNITGDMTQMQHDDLFSKIRQLDDGNGLHYLTEKLLKCGVDASKLLDEIILFMIKDEQFVALNVSASRRQQLFFRMMYLTSRLHHGCDQYLIVWHAVSIINYEMIASERVDI